MLNHKFTQLYKWVPGYWQWWIFCTTSRRTLIPMCLDASQRSCWLNRCVTLLSERLYKNLTCFLLWSSSMGDSYWPWPLHLQDSFVVRSFNPERNPCPLINELSLKLARKCVKAFGTLSYDQTMEIHNLSELIHFWNYNRNRTCSLRIHTGINLAPHTRGKCFKAVKKETGNLNVVNFNQLIIMSHNENNRRQCFHCWQISEYAVNLRIFVQVYFYIISLQTFV